ncbi:MAG: response regulator [Longimicrobiales bacterium]|nr:response regulator [Longimicrobiales bacterium]
MEIRPFAGDTVGDREPVPDLYAPITALGSPATPVRALALALLCLVAPLVVVLLDADWTASQAGALLIWIPALLPPFLLAFHRGWRGSSLALAAGMATLALAQVEILLLDLPAPPDWVVLAVVVTLLLVAVGAGWLADLLHTQRRVAVELALTDDLTGMPNRRHAMVFMESVWASARRGHQKLSVVLFDIDRFKRINDNHGHAAGDEVLRAIAEVFEVRGRKMDVSARLGGEEFVSVLAECDAASAVVFAEDIRSRVAGLRFAWGSVTLSAGVAEYVDGMGAPDVLIAAADRALFAAKDAGRDRVRRADELGAKRARVDAPVSPPEADPPTEADGDSDTARRSPSLGRSSDSSPDDGLAGLAVLLIDDDPSLLRSGRRILERFGCHVTAFSDPLEAVEAVQGGEVMPQVVVTDIVMPQISGFALVDMLGRVIDDLRVLYVSGYDQEHMYWSGAPGIRSAILGKPYRVEALRRELEQLALCQEMEASTEASTQAWTPEEDGWRRREPDGDGIVDLPAKRSTFDPHPGKILIVDDDEPLLRSLRRLFTREGYHTPETTSDPTKALQIFREWSPDLVMLDIHMPEVDGLEILRRLRKVGDPEDLIPVIVFSGDRDRDTRRKALELGATDFLTKPLDTTETLVRVRNALRSRFLHQRVLSDRDQLEARVHERTRELSDTRTEILHRLARAAEYRDDITGRHAARVGLLSALIAAELGMRPEDRELLRRTAPLHDIGKIGVPDRVLHKPGRLTDEEFAIIRQHTVIGARILEGGRHRILRMAKSIAESHHEHWDGNGYPHGLKGTEIPIEARIVAAADVFDVLTHARPYKGPKPPEEAVAEIVRCRGTHFDPQVSDAVKAICDRVGPAALPRLVDPVDPWKDTAFDEAVLQRQVAS